MKYHSTVHGFYYYAEVTDYTSINSTLTFSSGNLIECVSINITDDSVVELDQYFSVTVSDLQGAPPAVTLGTDNSATVTILDDGISLCSL